LRESGVFIDRQRWLKGGSGRKWAGVKLALGQVISGGSVCSRDLGLDDDVKCSGMFPKVFIAPPPLTAISLLPSITPPPAQQSESASDSRPQLLLAPSGKSTQRLTNTYFMLDYRGLCPKALVSLPV
jgi:hypothetical protein